MSIRTAFPLILAAWAVPVIAAAQGIIVDLKVEGSSRLPAEAIIEASGLKIGKAVSRPDLDRAAQRLLETGFFRSVNYRYEPKRSGNGAGSAVTLLVGEEKAERPVLLDFPGVDANELWTALRSADALIGPVMPDTDQASAHYQRAIEAALDRMNRRVPVTMRMEADLKTGKMAAIFRPVNLPSVSAVRFEGNQRIQAAVLAEAVSRLVVGGEYSERELRRILDLNIKPLYEEQGYLTVAFPSVRPAAAGDGRVSVAVAVDEGPMWMLGRVDVVGDDLPLAEMRKAARSLEGKPANWKQVTEDIAAMHRVLERGGYLRVSSNLERSYRKDLGIVDVMLRVDKGKQFRFGALQVKGLNAAAERDARAIWRLREGEPMNAAYIDDYLQSAFTGPARGSRTVQRELNLRPGTDVVDVVINFR